MSATKGWSSVMPVSTSTRPFGWSKMCTYTGIRSASASRSATRTGVTVIEEAAFISYRLPR